jgi:hypothetical protein
MTLLRMNIVRRAVGAGIAVLLAPLTGLQAIPVSMAQEVRPVEVQVSPTIPIPLTPLPTGIGTSLPQLPDPPPVVAAPTLPQPESLPITTTVVVPPCQTGETCPDQPEPKSDFEKAVEDIMNEFGKCMGEGKPLEQCLMDDPPPPVFTKTAADLLACLGSSDLAETKDKWEGCLRQE